jgi:hypothetical protein
MYGWCGIQMTTSRTLFWYHRWGLEGAKALRRVTTSAGRREWAKASPMSTTLRINWIMLVLKATLFGSDVVPSSSSISHALSWLLNKGACGGQRGFLRQSAFSDYKWWNNGCMVIDPCETKIRWSQLYMCGTNCMPGHIYNQNQRW